MLLDSLERSQFLLAVLPVRPHPCCPSCRQLFAEQKSSSCEGLMAWSWLPFHPCTHVLEKWFRPTVIGGGSPPQRNLGVGDDNLRPGMRV